ncbi:cupin domain-containing protein [Streptomyces hirsutus]
MDGREVVTLGPGDSLLVPIGVRHRLVSTGDVTARCAFHGLLPRSRRELGHVDTEQAQRPEQANPDVGGAR